MAIQRVDRVLNKEQISQQLEAVNVQQRLSLFTSNSFERAGQVRFSDGNSISVPSTSQQDQQMLNKLFGSVPPDARAKLDQATSDLGQAIYAETKSNPEGIKTGSFSTGFTSTVGLAASIFAQATGMTGEDTQVQGLLFMSMIGVEQNMGDFARMVQGKTKLAGELRTDMTELRNAISEWPEDGGKQHFEWTEVKYDSDGNMTVTHHKGDLTKKEAESKLKDLDEQLGTLRDMTEMDKFQLQQMVHDYQQAMNTLTAMLKNMHDTMKATIANVKA